MQYELDITIDDDGLDAIHRAGQAITVVKGVAAAGNMPVAWLQFRPMESNSVSWGAAYYGYATQTALQPGARIMRTSHSNGTLQAGLLYTLNAAGVFVGAPSAGNLTLGIANAHGDALGFGLAQAAVVNGVPVLSPVNAASLLNGERAGFTPDETVSVYLSPYIENGVLLADVDAGALRVMLTPHAPAASLGFDGASHRFYLADEAARLRKAGRRLQAAHR
jgi:hypothetical protein